MSSVGEDASAQTVLLLQWDLSTNQDLASRSIQGAWLRLNVRGVDDTAPHRLRLL